MIASGARGAASACSGRLRNEYRPVSDKHRIVQGSGG
jgi:hypothetical protein